MIRFPIGCYPLLPPLVSPYNAGNQQAGRNGPGENIPRFQNAITTPAPHMSSAARHNGALKFEIGDISNLSWNDDMLSSSAALNDVLNASLPDNGSKAMIVMGLAAQVCKFAGYYRDQCHRLLDAAMSRYSFFTGIPHKALPLILTRCNAAFGLGVIRCNDAEHISDLEHLEQRRIYNLRIFNE
jgi:hypothetical protein